MSILILGTSMQDMNTHAIIFYKNFCELMSIKINL